MNMEVMIIGMVICVGIIMWCLKLINEIWWIPKKVEKQLRQQGIYGDPYKLLFDGKRKEKKRLVTEAERFKPMELSHDIVPRIDPLLHMMAIKHKKAYVEWEGKRARLMIMDPKLIREILMKNFEFEKSEVHPSFKLFLTGLANYDGQKWAKHRKIINPAFHLLKLKRMLPSFMTCCEEMIQRWNNLVGSESSYEMDVMPEFQTLTGDVILRAAFGSNYEEGKKVFTLQKEQAQLFLHSMFTSKIPWSRFLPTRVYRRMNQIHGEVRDLLREIVEKREKAIELGETEADDDLLNLLLKSNYDELKESQNPSVGMTREDVIEECKLFYFAGHETTANVLTWTMIALCMHPIWQEKARQEVWKVFGKNTPTFDDLNRLKIVNMILLEVLRLYPPTALVRCTDEERKVGNLSLPPGVTFQIPVCLVHRDPQLWGDDAMEFNPDRFADGISKATKDQNAFFAFGWGPRICVGQNFAMLEAKSALSLILQNFSFELSPTYTHAPTIVLTLQPQFGAQIILHKI